MDPISSLIFWLAFLFLALTFVWELYLSLRQYLKYLETPERPDSLSEIIDHETFKKSRSYELDKMRFGFVVAIFDFLWTTVILMLELIPFLWAISGGIMMRFGFTSEILQSLTFVFLSSIAETLIKIPFSVYSTFVIEEKHGFNKQTPGFFIKDTVKKLAVSMALMLPILSLLIWVIKNGGPYFFVYVWLFLTCVLLIMLTVYPEFIAPLFDKYTPLEEGPLREKIEALANRVNYPLTSLYVVEGSKRSAHSNAYLYGFWKNKRIVLFDTLIGEKPVKTQEKPKEGDESSTDNEFERVPKVEESETVEDEIQDKNSEKEGTKDSEKTEDSAETKKSGLGTTNEEIEAVIGHELGHWALNHNIINIVVAELNLLLVMFCFGFFHQWPAVYSAFGFRNSQPTLIGLILILQFIFAPYNELLSFLMTLWRRKMEFEADEYSVDLGYADTMKSALIKLVKDNLSLPIDDWLYSFWHHDHPPICERIDAINKKN